MPKQRQITREMILDAALQSVLEKGFDALSARRLAERMGCSVQPIYSVFASMDEVKEAVMRYCAEQYFTYIQGQMNHHERPYLASGLAYIHFAIEKENLFRLLFMSKAGREIFQEIPDQTLPMIFESVQKMTNLDLETVKKFHLAIWIFTHGIATMIVTKTITLTEEEIIQLLEEEYNARKEKLMHERKGD